MGRLRSLEALRGLAALLVVLYHTEAIFQPRLGYIPFHNVFGAGNRGVDLFFVLSGFIIAYVHRDDIGRPERLPNYIFNRLARVYPSVWIMTTLSIGLYSLGFGGEEKAGKLAPDAMIASFLLLPQRGVALVNVSWTLTYELFFYAAFAVLILNRRLGLALMLLWQGAIITAAIINAHLGFEGYYLRPICLEFGVGFLCAWLSRRSLGRSHTALWSYLLGFGIVSFASGMVFDRLMSWSGAACAIGAGAIVLSLVRLEQTGRLYVPQFIAFVGEGSYAIYLIHFSTLALLAAALSRLHIPINEVVCLLCAVVAMCAGLAFDYIVDRPIQVWLRRRKSALLGSASLQSTK